MIVTGQVSVGTSEVTLVTVPVNPCIVILSSDPGSASTVYVGTTTGVSSSNGIPLGAGQSFTFAGYHHVLQGGQAQLLYAICASGSATVGYLMSEDPTI